MWTMKNQPAPGRFIQRLPKKVQWLLRQVGALADEQGVALYLVGGVVRDLLLKRENWDLDFTVEGDGIAFAELVADRYGAGLAVFERFATARLVFPDGLKMDIATTRRESYAQPAFLPTVQPASIEEDLSRRDFTINAIAVQLNPAAVRSLARSLRRAARSSGSYHSRAARRQFPRRSHAYLSERSGSNNGSVSVLSALPCACSRKRPPRI